MKKTIRIRMTSATAEKLGYDSRFELCIAPVEVDTEALSAPAAYIVDHVTSTYVIDEYFDKIDLAAVAGFSMMERDKQDWKYSASEDFRDKVAAFAAAYGDEYTTKPMRIPVTFPIYSDSIK